LDNSTKGVTLTSGFVFDVLREYEDSRRVLAPLFELAKGLDPRTPEVLCSMDTYNDVCTWIEENVGESSIRNAGRAIADRVYATVTEGGKSSKTPLEIVQALQWAASTMIHDPKKRGWEIVENSENRIVMRRTQTFNCLLQEGLLIRLLELTRVTMPVVKHERCTRKGDDYCDYALTWMRARRR
jgi:hypothetical protein